MTPRVRKIDHCRGCGDARLFSLYTLGEQYIVDFVDEEAKSTRGTAPLELCMCLACNLVQLRHTVAADILFRQFWYKSGINQQMQAALENVVDESVRRIPLKTGDQVLDIGANDGTLLAFYPSNCYRVAVDPAKGFAASALADKRADEYIEDYLTPEVVQGRRFKIITAIAMFYDLDDPLSFLRAVAACLDKEGLFVIQMNYLLMMILRHTLDNLSHEHLCYYSLRSIAPLLDKAGLAMVDADTNDVNGGSIRIYITHKQSNIFAKLHCKDKLLSYGRAEECLRTIRTYNEFVQGCELMIEQVKSTVAAINERGGTVYAYGASTRGTVLMQVLNFDRVLVKGAAERDKRKWGKFMVGTWTPIVSEQEARAAASHFLVLPYHFIDGILKREEAWLRGGGRMIVPLPEPVTYFYDNEGQLCRQPLSQEPWAKTAPISASTSSPSAIV